MLSANLGKRAAPMTIEKRLDQLEKRTGFLTIASIVIVVIAIQFSAYEDVPAGPSCGISDPDALARRNLSECDLANAMRSPTVGSQIVHDLYSPVSTKASK